MHARLERLSTIQQSSHPGQDVDLWSNGTSLSYFPLKALSSDHKVKAKAGHASANWIDGVDIHSRDAFGSMIRSYKFSPSTSLKRLPRSFGSFIWVGPLFGLQRLAYFYVANMVTRHACAVGKNLHHSRVSPSGARCAPLVK